MERLGTMTRGQILLQSDPSVGGSQLRKLFAYYGEIDKVNGLKEKMKYANALSAVLRELSIPFRVSGPFEKRLPRHTLPEGA